MSKTLSDLRHSRSAQDFPFLSLEEGEYVVISITRSRMGLIMIWFTEIVLALVCTLALILFDRSPNLAGFGPALILRSVMFIVYAVLALSGIIGTKVYLDNKLFITNRRAIQITSNALFHKSTNIIKLSRIEDVSYSQKGLLDYIFHFGTIRMSTVGDETTYTMRFVDTPTDEIETISHLVYEQKEGKEEKSSQD